MTRFEVELLFDQIKTFDVNFRPKLNGVFYIEGYENFYYKAIIKRHDLYLYKPKYVLHYDRDPLGIYTFELLFNEKNIHKFIDHCLYTQEIIKITHDSE